MPAYNEVEGIEQAVHEVQCCILDSVEGANLIVVDDGSRDGTGEMLDRLAAQNRRFQVIHQPNGGHGAALRTGLNAARGTYVLLIDSDRQIPLEAFEVCWVAARRRDGVFGVRSERDDPRIRLMLTHLIRWVVAFLFGVSLADANAPFKIFRRSVWEEAQELVPAGTLALSLFIAVYMQWRGMDVLEVFVPHRRRRTGRGSIRGGKLIRFSIQAFFQLLRFRQVLPQRKSSV